jgi:hypothetical protein
MVDEAVSFADGASSVVHKCRHGIWVDIGGWSSILDVSLSVVMHRLGWNSERASSISAPIRELGDAGSLMGSCQPLVVVSSVELDVKGVLLLELDHHVVDVLHTLGSLSHGFG